MKTVEPAIYELLKTLASGHVYVMRAPDNAAAPFIIFQRIDSERWRDINAPSGMAKASIQIDCYHSSYYASKSLAGMVEEILDGYKGTVLHGSGSPQQSVIIAGVVLENDVDILDQEDEPALFRNSAVYSVTYNQRD